MIKILVSKPGEKSKGFSSYGKMKESRSLKEAYEKRSSN